MENDKTLGGYSVILKEKEGKFVLLMPDLSITVEGDSLDEAYRELIRKKLGVLEEYAKVREDPPTPKKISLSVFSNRFLVFTSVFLLVAALITGINLTIGNFSSSNSPQETTSFNEASFERLKKSLLSSLDDQFFRLLNITNIALNKPARQSSNYEGYPYSRGGVDGVKNGEFGFHTNQENDPWWEVDLGAESLIKEIRVYNRMCCKTGNYSLSILVSTDYKKWRVIYKNNGKEFGGIDGKYLKVAINNKSARWVRLQLEGDRHFFLDEVEVYGKAK